MFSPIVMEFIMKVPRTKNNITVRIILFHPRLKMVAVYFKPSDCRVDYFHSYTNNKNSPIKSSTVTVESELNVVHLFPVTCLVRATVTLEIGGKVGAWPTRIG